MGALSTKMRVGSWCVALVLAGCGGGTNVVIDVDSGATPGVDRPSTGLDVASTGDAQLPSFDVQRTTDVVSRDVRPNYDAFFAENPLPRYCGPDGGGDAGPAPDLPGGTAECPDDLTREGCACEHVGEMRSCWPGLRVNRNRGICHDGMTTCQPFDELTGRWGPCEGYQLPDPMARLGPGSCQCFSRGRWEITNTSPCFVTVRGGTGGDVVWAVSTYLDAMGTAHCPDIPMNAMPPFMPQAGTTFSTNALTVDCTGQFQLCYVMRAGDGAHPSPSDCVVARACTSAWYMTPNARQVFPPLPAWSGTDSACATRFVNTGGYGEMTVQGVSSECQSIDDGSRMPYVFNRVTYCPTRCNSMPTLPECRMCGNGGAGMF